MLISFLYLVQFSLFKKKIIVLISEHLSELLYTRGCKIKNSIEGRQLIWNKPMRAVGRDDVSAKTGKHRSPGATNIQIEKEKKKKKR